MSLLRLSVLGTPEVFHDGSRLSFALHKPQALLFYLAVEGGMHPRSKLAALLWPDSDPPDARKGLRNAITLLRSRPESPLRAGWRSIRSRRRPLAASCACTWRKAMRRPLCRSTPPCARAWLRSCRSNLLRTPSPWRGTVAPLRLAQGAARLVAARGRASRQASWWPRWSDGRRPFANWSAAFSRRGRGGHRRCCWSERQG